MRRARPRTGVIVVWTLAALLLVAHQDFFLWDDRTLVFGIVPIGLAYHVGFSIACTCLWLLAVRFAWPAHIEEWAGRGDDEAARGGRVP